MEAFLFIPCLVEHVLPQVGEATVVTLARAGVSPVLPKGQTCCGQFAYKRGRVDLVRPLARRFVEIFADAPVVVCPSGSCTAMVRRYPSLFADGDPWRERASAVAAKTFELGQYLVDELGVIDLGARFAARATLHASCQTSRVLGAGSATEALLAKVAGLTLAPLARPERCCGFGGAFSVDYPEVSQAILSEKIDDIVASGAEAVITAEPSCLVNIASALAKREIPVRPLHLAEVLAGGAS
ncbi:MAG: (Fe-S)-binding protein [Acidobacteriota bacterium]